GLPRASLRAGPALGAGLSHNAVLESQECYASTIWQRSSGSADDRRPRRRRNALAVGPGGGRRLASRRGPGPWPIVLAAARRDCGFCVRFGPAAAPAPPGGATRCRYDATSPSWLPRDLGGLIGLQPIGHNADLTSRDAAR